MILARPYNLVMFATLLSGWQTGAHAQTPDKPFIPQPILTGGIVVPLYPPDSKVLNASRLAEPEQWTMTSSVAGRVQNIVNIHNPSIEVHKVEGTFNTGAAIILLAGGAHRTLNVGTEAGDVVSFFFNYGVNTVILRNRLRGDGYDLQADAVRDTLQAIRVVRAGAKTWGIDPRKIGVMGFSAGAELAASAGLDFATDKLAGDDARPDFVALLYPGPTPFSRAPATAIPPNAPPAFVATPGSGDRVHAMWAIDYVSALIKQGVPNVEMHIYGNGVHGHGLKDREGIPYGTWQHRFIDWFRDLGFLLKPGVETKAAQDLKPPQPPAQARPKGVRPATK